MGMFPGLREGRIALLQLNIKLEAIADVCEPSDNWSAGTHLDAGLLFYFT